MNRKQYLFNDPQEFFDSPMWHGERFYNATRYKPWFGYIYIALYKHIPIENYKKDPNPDIQMKIGHSGDIDRRNKELFRDATIDGKEQKACAMVYVWSVPRRLKFENDLKTFLYAFIDPARFPNRSGATEIVCGIPILTLINMVQLSIFKTCMELEYIKSDMQFTLRPPDTIQHVHTYNGTLKFVVPQTLNIYDTFAALDYDLEGDKPDEFKDYLFTQDTRIPEVNTEPERPRIAKEPPMYITTTQFMNKKVYPIDAYLYAEYEDMFGNKSNHLAQVVGYAGVIKVEKQYAIKWLKVVNGNPVEKGNGFELTDDPWQYTRKVFKVQGALREKYTQFRTKQIELRF